MALLVEHAGRSLAVFDYLLYTLLGMQRLRFRYERTRYDMHECTDLHVSSPHRIGEQALCELLPLSPLLLLPSSTSSLIKTISLCFLCRHSFTRLCTSEVTSFSTSASLWPIMALGRLGWLQTRPISSFSS